MKIITTTMFDYRHTKLAEMSHNLIKENNIEHYEFKKFNVNDYFNTIINLNCDYIVSFDIDCFIFDFTSVMDIINTLEQSDYSYAGFLDRGDTIVQNQAFNVFKVKDIKPIWTSANFKNNEKYKIHPKQNQQTIDKQVHRYREPYYKYYLALYYNDVKQINLNHSLFKFNENILINLNSLNPPKTADLNKTIDTTIIFDLNNKPFCTHTWYSRYYRVNEPNFYGTKRINTIYNNLEKLKKDGKFN